MRCINNSTQSLLNPYTTARPNGCCFLGPPCYHGSEETCIIRSKAHQAQTPAEASVWPECSERAAHCLTLQVYPDPSTFATPRRAQEECTSIMAYASTLATRAWSMTCDGWDAIDEISPSSDYVLCKILPSVAAWLLHMLSLASTIWHLHQHNLSRVQLTHEHTSTRILDAIGDTLDKLKRSEASVAAAKLMVALAVLNTSNTTQAWACLLLALPVCHDHLADTALKAPSAAQQAALWTTSAGLRLLDATRAAASIAGRAADMLLLPLLRRPSASIKARFGASRARAAATSLRVTGALQQLDRACQRPVAPGIIGRSRHDGRRTTLCGVSYLSQSKHTRGGATPPLEPGTQCP